MVVLEPAQPQYVDSNPGNLVEVAQPITSPVSSKVITNGYWGPSVTVFGPLTLVVSKSFAAAVSGQGRPLPPGSFEVGKVRVEPFQEHSHQALLLSASSWFRHIGTVAVVVEARTFCSSRGLFFSDSSIHLDCSASMELAIC